MIADLCIDHARRKTSKNFQNLRSITYTIPSHAIVAPKT